MNEVEKGVRNKTEIAKAYDIPKSTLSGILFKKETIKSEYHSTNHNKYKYSRMSCPTYKRDLQKGDSVDINNSVLLLKVLYLSLPDSMFVIKF